MIRAVRRRGDECVFCYPPILKTLLCEKRIPVFTDSFDEFPCMGSITQKAEANASIGAA
jgi:hypothetical protein